MLSQTSNRYYLGLPPNFSIHLYFHIVKDTVFICGIYGTVGTSHWKPSDIIDTKDFIEIYEADIKKFKLVGDFNHVIQKGK